MDTDSGGNDFAVMDADGLSKGVSARPWHPSETIITHYYYSFIHESKLFDANKRPIWLLGPTIQKF